ncbi:uncharacterized protein LOC105169482 isoform X1 [Sesamum indicum]|uniref:Uncharacterized protein LOC105169482 isoform X1 n=1 Tax=Sesamum indicum TaxID=4182 RepID=A0A6I9TR60_SESIN|nr:uncharacterized protein LOC105169482 isoform X1 [Sesamum indicum]
MGNWNRRYQPRKKFRHYEYEDPPLSPPRPHDTRSYSSGVNNNGVSSWEIDYCHSVWVPWRKVLASKKYIYCHPSVLNWDDSAGKEALQNAKERYWALINGLPCGNPLPDPDVYIDEIDWNPYMDPDLMADLDLQVFDPDNAQKIDKLEAINEEAACAEVENDENPSTCDNPWERNHVQDTGSLKDIVQGWGRWDDSVNLKNDDPWEQSCSKPVDALKDNGWRSGNDSWVWYQGIDNTRSAAVVDYGCGNSCNYIRQTGGPVRQKGLGHKENNSWGRSHGNTNVEGSRNSDNCGHSNGNNYSMGSKERSWRNNRDKSWVQQDNRKESWGWRDSAYQDNEPKSWDSQRSKPGGRSVRGIGRKREGSLQQTSKYKSSRYHGETYGDSHQL